MAEEQRRGDEIIELKLSVPEATRRELKVLAAETGTTMGNLITAWVEDNWKSSATFRRRMMAEGRCWTDTHGALHEPDGSLYRAHTHAEERAEREAKRGGAR